MRTARTLRRYVLAFAASAIVACAVIGDRGILAVMKVRRDLRTLDASLSALKAENDALRGEAYRLRTDLRAIEAIARGELGLARRDERLFIVSSPQR